MEILPNVEQKNNELVVSSSNIADGAGIEHRSVLQLIRTHQDKLERFGRVTFEMRPIQTAGGVQNSNIALLNEQQSTLLLTFTRNTEKVVNFKVNLVDKFYEMAQQLRQPLSDDQIMHQALEISSRRIAALEPKAEAWDTLAGAKGDYSVAEAAQVLSRDDRITIGRNRLFEFMGHIGWLYRGSPRNSWHAYQDQVDNGRLVRRMSSAFQNQKTGELELPAPTIRITAKGVEALRTRLLEEVAA